MSAQLSKVSIIRSYNLSDGHVHLRLRAQCIERHEIFEPLLMESVNTDPEAYGVRHLDPNSRTGTILVEYLPIGRTPYDMASIINEHVVAIPKRPVTFDMLLKLHHRGYSIPTISSRGGNLKRTVIRVAGNLAFDALLTMAIGI